MNPLLILGAGGAVVALLMMSKKEVPVPPGQVRVTFRFDPVVAPEHRDEVLKRMAEDVVHEEGGSVLSWDGKKAVVALPGGGGDGKKTVKIRSAPGKMHDVTVSVG